MATHRVLRLKGAPAGTPPLAVFRLDPEPEENGEDRFAIARQDAIRRANATGTVAEFLESTEVDGEAVKDEK